MVLFFVALPSSLANGDTLARLLNVCLTCRSVELGVLRGGHMVDSLPKFPYPIGPMSGKWPLLPRHTMMP